MKHVKLSTLLFQVYDRLEEDVGGRLTEHVGKMVSRE